MEVTVFKVQEEESWLWTYAYPTRSWLIMTPPTLRLSGPWKDLGNDEDTAEGGGGLDRALALRPDGFSAVGGFFA